MRALRRTALLVGLAGLAAALAVGLARPERATAHAVLERSVPAQDQRLAEPPTLVETWYSEPLEQSLTSLRVLDTEGNPVHVGETAFSDDPLYAAVALPADLAPGIYTVAYQNVSTVDGHQWTGSFSFIVLNPDGSVPAGTAFQATGPEGGGQGYLPEVGDTTLRWFGLSASVVLVGAVLFHLLIARPAAQFLEDEKARSLEGAAMALAADLTALAMPALIVSVLGQLFLLADRLGGLEALDDILFHTRTGELWIARGGLGLAVLLLLLPALVSERYRVGARATAAVALALLGGLGLLVTYSLGSHAGAANGGEFWAVSSDFVHFVATAAWLGALLQLVLAFWWTRRLLDGPERLLYLANLLDRFSWLAVVSVALLIGTGVFNGFVQLPRLPALWETTYGRVLIAKLALIVPMLGVAAINALFLKPALVDAIDALHGGEEEPVGDERSRLEQRLARLRTLLPRTSLAEAALGIAVLASVALLTQTTTAGGELRQTAAQPSEPFAARTEREGLTLDLTIEPFTVGVNTFTLQLAPQPGAELGEVLGVELRAAFDDPNAPPSAGTSFTSQELTATGDPGVFAAEAALLTRPGDWRLQARVRRRGFDDVVANFSAPQVGGALAQAGPAGLFDLPFTFVDWNIVAGGALTTLGLGIVLVWRNRPPSWQPGAATAVGLSGAFAMMAGAVLLFGVHAHEVPVARTSPIPASAQSLALGQELFERNCQVCHGAEGRGDGPGAGDLNPPDLTLHVPFHTDGTLFTWISDGIERDGTLRMPAFKDELTEDERWHLINFLREAFGSGDFEPVLPEDTPPPAPSP